MPDFGRGGASGGDPSLHDIKHTDQFLDALAAQQPVYASDRGEAELASLLSGGRAHAPEPRVAPMRARDAAAAALDRGGSPGRRRRISLAVVGSAAAAVLCLGGFGAVVAGSGPGDALYGLRTMMFGDQSPTVRDDAVILAAQTEMQQVAQLIEQGDWEGAKVKLEAVTTTVATVGDDERKQDLVTQWQELTVKVEAQDPAATPAPGAPLPTFPEVPVVALDPDLPAVTPPTETEPADPAEPTETDPAEPTETDPAEPTEVPDSPQPPEPVEEPAPAEPGDTTTTPVPTSPAASPPVTTTVEVPAPTSVPTSTVVEQSTSAVRVTPSPTTPGAPSPTTVPTTTVTSPPAAAPAPTTAPTTTVAPAEAQEPASSPTTQVIPTTTTLLPVLPAEETG